MTYMKKDADKLITLDPYLYFDLHYNYIRDALLVDDLTTLNEYMKEYLIQNLQSSKSLPEKNRAKRIKIYYFTYSTI